MGIPVWTLQPTSIEREVVATKLTRSLELTAEHDARTLQRLRMHTIGIIVADHSGRCGAWLRAPRLVQVSMHHLLNTENAAEHVAATIAHEATHAWMDSRGIQYDPARRHRIEAVCYRSEARLARRLPGCSELAAFYLRLAEQALEDGPSRWSWESTVERDIKELELLGTPQWLRKLVRRVALRRSA